METISNKLVILLADDNPGDIRLTQKAFKESQILVDIHIAKDGIEALAFLNKQGNYATSPTADLMLLDLNMPGMNGLEVLARIKSNPILKSLPIIILSTSEREQDISQSYEMQADYYLTKPMEYERYLDLVKQIENFWVNFVNIPPQEAMKL